MTKYKSVFTECKQGHLHHSKGESYHCNDLALLVKTGHYKDYKTQMTFNLVVNGKHICRHTVDFLVTNKDDSIEVHEFKGVETRDFKIKRKLFEVLYPAILYRVLK